MCLIQEPLEWFPIVALPSGLEVLLSVLGEAGLIENEQRAAALFAELEFDYRINAGRPIAGTPGLHDALVRHELDDAAGDHTSEAGEHTTGLARHLCGRTS